MSKQMKIVNLKSWEQTEKPTIKFWSREFLNQIKMKKKILSISLILIALFTYGQVPTVERDALIALYNSTDGANWTNNTNWNTAQPVSTWYGITVANISGQDHVTEIHFNNNNLNGSLPAEIGDLTEIVNIEIIFNSLLTGNIPSQIGNLTNLEQLSFWDDNLTGNIPSELGNCTSLTVISLEDNLLTGNIPASFSNLTAMTSFWVNGNQLSGDIPDIFSGWTNLDFFSIGNGNNTSGAHNDFTGTLDLSNNNALRLCWVDNTMISSLNIQNGNNSNVISDSYFRANNNPYLTCIFVDDATYSNANWTYIDATATFLETQAECDALFTNIPDNNFEQALIDQGYDNIADNKVRTSNINTLTSLDIRNKNISNLTGINDFVALSYLNIGNNNISNLDVSNNINLTGLYCYNNNISSLNLDNNTNLSALNCSGNNLSNLVINNLPITGLYCALNNLTSLDLSNNNSIERLWCYGNNLTELDIRNGANYLLSGTYTVGSNTYARFRATDNPNLTCIYVDNATDANNFVGDYLNWEIDVTSTFVETETECNALNIDDETFQQSIEIYPNPTLGILYINNIYNLSIKEITIINTLGQKIFKSKEVSNLDISNFPNGIYYINIENSKGNKVSYKIIKG